MVDIPEDYRNRWSYWELRLLVIFSFFLQVFLTIVAPLRRGNKSKWVGPFIWVAYLSADWVAAFALAMLSGVIHDSSRGGALTSCDNALVAFWAPFLLAHLGGPDTITAFALEDNELWPRHFLTLGIHLVAAVYVFLLTLPMNHLLAPALLMLLVGIGRYLERTWALYLASSHSLPRWAACMRIVLPTITEEGIDGVEMVKSAHRFFITYDRLFQDGTLFSIYERDESKSFFQRLRPKDAVGIIEVELDLACDALYTKAVAIHNRIGYIWRAICFFSILTALAIFPPLHKCRSKPVDEAITYLLLIGAAAVEVIALVNIIFSNWMLISHLKYLEAFSESVYPYGPPKRPRYISQYNYMISFRFGMRRQRRQSRIIAIQEYLQSIFDCNRRQGSFERSIEKFAITSKVRVSEMLPEFIFIELRKMSEEATDIEATRNVMSRRWDEFMIGTDAPEELLERLQQLKLVGSIVMWHMTTTLCYYRTRPTQQDQLAVAHKDMMMHISNYMFYLLIKHPSMISTEGDTAFDNLMCQDALGMMVGKTHEVESFCNSILDEYETRGSLVELSPACSLAEWVLKQTNWEVVLCKVWVNMLSHAARHSSGRFHAQRLVEGGELLTFVWFLMAHLDTDQYILG